MEKELKLPVPVEDKQETGLLKCRMRVTAERLEPDYRPGEALTEFTIALESDHFYMLYGAHGPPGFQNSVKESPADGE
jgi:hypothetical protein